MYTVNIYEAKTHFSKLLDKVAHGEEVVIGKAGKPIAKIIPFKKSTKARKPGFWKGKIVIHEDFDELPSGVLAAFKGERE